MIKLFKYEGYEVVISEEALLLMPFKAIWKRDKDKKKSRALQELGYIYFMVDPRSDYQHYTDPNDRHYAILEGEGLPNDWKPDNLIMEAMKFYDSFKPVTIGLLEDARSAVTKVRKYLSELDLNERDENGKLLHSISSVTTALKSIPALIMSLDEAEKKLSTEVIDTGKLRGQGVKKVYEDGI